MARRRLRMAAIGGIVSLVPFRWPLPAAVTAHACACLSQAKRSPFSTTSPQQQVWHDPGHATLALLAQNQNPYTAATAYVVRPIISSAIHGAGNAVRGAVNRVSNALGAASAASAMAAPYGYYLGEQAASASAYPLVPAVYSGIPDGSAQRFPQQGTGNEYYLHGMGHSYGASAPPPYGHGGYTNPYPVYTAPSLLTEVANHAAGGVASVAGLATNAVRSVTGMASQATQMATQGIATGLQTRPQIPWNEALSIAEKFVVPSIEAIAKAAPSIAARSPGEGPEEQGLKRLRRGDKGQETSPPDPNAPPPGSVPEKRPRLYVSQVGNAAVVN